MLYVYYIKTVDENCANCCCTCVIKRAPPARLGDVTSVRKIFKKMAHPQLHFHAQCILFTVYILFTKNVQSTVKYLQVHNKANFKSNKETIKEENKTGKIQYLYIYW